MRSTITASNASQLSPVAMVRVGWITSVAFSPDNQIIAIAGGTQSRLYVHSFGATPSLILEGHDAPVKDIAFSHDGNLLASVGEDGAAFVWSVVNNTPRLVHSLHYDDALTCVTFSADARRLIAGTQKGGIHVWDLSPGSGFDFPHPHTGEVYAVAWRMGQVFSAGRDGQLLRRDMAQWKDKPAVIASHPTWIRDFALTPDARTAYIVGKDGMLCAWSSGGQPLFEVMAHEGGADCIALSSNGQLLVTGGRDNLARVWDVAALNGAPISPVALLDVHRKPVLSVALNGSGTFVLTASGDNTARLWSVEERNTSGN